MVPTDDSYKSDVKAMAKRRSIKSYSLHRRYLGMSCKEKRITKRDLKRIQQLILLLAAVDDDVTNVEIEEWIVISIIFYRRLTEENVVMQPARVIHPRITIQSFSSIQIPSTFRFRSTDQSVRLHNSLGIPAKIVMPSRHTCSGEELFLVGLTRISSVARLQDFERIFHRGHTSLSQVFWYFVTWMERKHGWRLYDNLNFWVPHFVRFAKAIRSKAVSLSGDQLNFLPHQFRIAMVTDCCNQIISRPGAGPAVDCPDAARRDPPGWLQRVFYNGWLADSGMKYGTVESPCGMTIFLSSGLSSRHSDLTSLTNSEINPKLETAQTEYGIDPYNLFKMYGDSIFPWMSCFRYKSNDINEVERLENRVMSSCGSG